MHAPETAESIPPGPGDLTPGWLTSALRSAGQLAADASVGDVSSERIGEGAGFIGEIVRLRLGYEPPDAGPASMIAKFPSPEPGARAVGNMYGLYAREVSFYRELAASCGVDTPACYFAGMDPAGDRYLVLLEDMAPSGTIGDQVGGCSVDQARLALSELASIHSRWWASEQLSAMPWLSRGTDLVRGPMETFYPALQGKFLELFGEELTPEIRAVVPALGEAIIGLLDEVDLGAMTLAHGDYRLDNMFFGNGDARYRLAVVDWQSPNIGWPAYDVAYFLCGSLPVAMRREHEDAMLRSYHGALVSGGVQGYDFDRFFLDYRRSLIVYLAIFVINGATLEISNQRAVELFKVIFERLVAAITDLRALDVLPEAASPS